MKQTRSTVRGFCEWARETLKCENETLETPTKPQIGVLSASTHPLFSYYILKTYFLKSWINSVKTPLWKHRHNEVNQSTWLKGYKETIETNWFLLEIHESKLPYCFNHTIWCWITGLILLYHHHHCSADASAGENRITGPFMSRFKTNSEAETLLLPNPSGEVAHTRHWPDTLEGAILLSCEPRPGLNSKPLRAP